MGGRGGGLNGQAKRAKRDHSHNEIGGQIGKRVNNFVADCPKYNNCNGLKVQIHHESFILPCNLPLRHFRFIPVDIGQ